MKKRRSKPWRNIKHKSNPLPTPNYGKNGKIIVDKSWHKKVCTTWQTHLGGSYKDEWVPVMLGTTEDRFRIAMILPPGLRLRVTKADAFEWQVKTHRVYSVLKDDAPTARLLLAANGFEVVEE